MNIEIWIKERDKALRAKNLKKFKELWRKVMAPPSNPLVYEITMHKLRVTRKLDSDGSSTAWLLAHGYHITIRE